MLKIQWISRLLLLHHLGPRAVSRLRVCPVVSPRKFGECIGSPGEGCEKLELVEEWNFTSVGVVALTESVEEGEFG